MNTATLVPFDLVQIMADEAISPQGKPRNAQFCIAIGKVLANKNHPEYVPYKSFLEGMSPNERLSLCDSVSQEIEIRKRH